MRNKHGGEVATTQSLLSMPHIYSLPGFRDTALFQEPEAPKWKLYPSFLLSMNQQKDSSCDPWTPEEDNAALQAVFSSTFMVGG